MMVGDLKNDICHICGKPFNETGGEFCYAVHTEHQKFVIRFDWLIAFALGVWFTALAFYTVLNQYE